MLKFYHAYDYYGDVGIDDYISFFCGIHYTGKSDSDSFGEVKSRNHSCREFNYEMLNLKSFREYLQNVKVTDGFVDNFVLWSPLSYAMLEEQYKDVPKDFDSYEKCGLNEEGIILFTDYVCLEYKEDGLVQRVFGRYPETGMYLLMPNASFIMSAGSYPGQHPESFEVLQSQTLGKQLFLTRMPRTDCTIKKNN